MACCAVAKRMPRVANDNNEGGAAVPCEGGIGEQFLFIAVPQVMQEFAAVLQRLPQVHSELEQSQDIVVPLVKEEIAEVPQTMRRDGCMTRLRSE